MRCLLRLSSRWSLGCCPSRVSEPDKPARRLYHGCYHSVCAATTFYYCFHLVYDFTGQAVMAFMRANRRRLRYHLRNQHPPLYLIYYTTHHQTRRLARRQLARRCRRPTWLELRERPRWSPFVLLLPWLIISAIRLLLIS